MLSYAGIGSRSTTEEERKNIKLVAKIMAKSDYILYSGNAEGSDIAFQEGSDGKCVIMLPWKRFNEEEYDFTFSRDHFVVGDTAEGIASVTKFHPNPTALKGGGMALMARNFHQVCGYGQYPGVSIVICCADESNGKVQGGTGQAVRIAQSLGIPVINIRAAGWRDRFKEFLKR